MYSSGEDSWEDERRGRHRRNDKLEVPALRSRTSSPKVKHEGRARDYDSGKRSPSPYKSSARSPRNTRKESPPPRPRSKFEIRKSYSPSKERHSSERMKNESKSDSYARFGSPRSGRSSAYSRSPRRHDINEDSRREYRSPRRDRREHSPKYRRDSPEEIEKFRYRKQYRYDTEYTDTLTDSPEEYFKRKSRADKDDLEKKQELIKEPEKKSSVVSIDTTKNEMKTEEVDYENYRTQDSKVEMKVEKSDWGRNSPLNRVAAIEDKYQPAENTQIETIHVEPVKEEIVEEQHHYSSQLKMVEDSNNFLVAMPEDDGDSGIGFTLSDFHEENEKKNSKSEQVSESQVPNTAKQWTLLSFSPTGPMKVKDDETGEIFTIINEFPQQEDNTENTSVKETDKIIDEEDDVGWCSLYLISRVLGLAIVCAGIAGMVIIALNK